MALAMKSTTMRASALQKPKVASRKALVCRAGYLGSTTNLIMVATTALTLSAARFGLAPTVRRTATAGLKLTEKKDSVGVLSGDPAGFTIVDVLAMGSAGHIIGAGIVLGLRNTGNL